MQGDADIAAIGALIGDPTRATILAALADGRALPAGELAARAGVAASTASAQLAQLVAGNLLSVEAHGRHRYYRLAGPRVARLLETLAGFAPPRPVRSLREAQTATALRQARTCYDHLAGAVGVALTERLVEANLLALADHGYDVTAEGTVFFADLGIDLAPPGSRRRPLTRRCLDWTERRYHLAGALGAELARSFFERGWIVRASGSRAVRVTAAGRAALEQALGLALPA